MPGMPCRHVPKLDSDFSGVCKEPDRTAHANEKPGNRPGDRNYSKVMKRSYQSVISAFVSVHFGTEGLRSAP